MRDQRAKIEPKGSFQLGSVDKAAVMRDQRAAAKADRLQRQIQQKQEVDFATFASTSSQDISCESSSEETGEVICLSYILFHFYVTFSYFLSPIPFSFSPIFALVIYLSFQQTGDEDEQFKLRRHPCGAYSFLKTPRYAMELIRGDVSSNLGASLANAFLLDLQAMDLLKPGLDVKQIIVDKSKIDREKDRMKVKSDEKHNDGLEKLICIGVDGKVDKTRTLCCTEKLRIKKGK